MFIFAANLTWLTQKSDLMVSVSNISYFIGGRPLYQGASMFIKPDDKIGLIGLNGRGKSTLLRIINGDLKVDEGSISKSKDCTIGFLNQDLLSYQSPRPAFHRMGGELFTKLRWSRCHCFARPAVY